MDDKQFRNLLEYLDYSWTGYRKVRKGVKKRIQRHMQQLRCRNISAYLRVLEQHPERRQECELLMTVSISRFFRDRWLWQMLEKCWLPEIIVENPIKINVWSAGCGCGQEAYSFKIIWEHLKKDIDSMPQLELMATDRHPRYLAHALSGVYGLSSLKEVDIEDQIHFFDRIKGVKNQFVIKDELKSDIRWKKHHLSNPPPGMEFIIIFMRNNILTYCRQKDQKRMVNRILSSLRPGGLFIIGCHEVLPFKTDRLNPKDHLPFVYCKT
jgi:chemotaxis protein methyltransferase CheR